MGPKIRNLVEDVEILLPVKFRWIPFSGFRAEVENVSANQRPGWPSCFSDQLEKHKGGGGRLDLASCQVSLNSVQRFERKSWKCLSQLETRAAHRPKNQELGRGRWDLAYCQVSLNSIQWFQRRSRKCLSQSRGQDGYLVFPIGLKNTNLVENIDILLPVKFRWIPLCGFRGEVENVKS